MRDKQEVEVVDFLLQVKDCVVSHVIALTCLGYTFSLSLSLSLSLTPSVKSHQAVPLCSISNHSHTTDSDKVHHILSTRGPSVLPQNCFLSSVMKSCVLIMQCFYI